MVRGRSLLWAGPGVLLLGGRPAAPTPSATKGEEPDPTASAATLIAVPVADELPAPGDLAAMPSPPEAARRRR